MRKESDYNNKEKKKTYKLKLIGITQHFNLQVKSVQTNSINI